MKIVHLFHSPRDWEVQEVAVASLGIREDIIVESQLAEVISGWD